MDPSSKVRRLTGIRPTGRMHLGHYFAVIRPALDLGATVLIADYHAPQVAYATVDAIQQGLLAFGVRNFRLQHEDFHPATYFKLLSIARVGELERMTQYMNTPGGDAHLLVYPVLMTHDVMGYDEILVGDDQTQHINYARDLIGRYNRTFGVEVALPRALAVGGRVLSLSDPAHKMSKSEPGGCLFLDDSPEETRHKIRRAVTTPEGRANLEALYGRLGGQGFISELNSVLKPMLAELVIGLLRHR